MTSHELLGTEAKSFIERYGDYRKSSLEMPWMIDKTHQIYSQSITEDMFVRPECKCNYECNHGDKCIAFEWKPLFKGDWEMIETNMSEERANKVYQYGQVKIKIYEDGEAYLFDGGWTWYLIKTLNDLITNSPVKLEWNEFEI